MKDSLERSLQKDEEKSETVEEWVADLPAVSPQGINYLNKVFSSHDFRQVDPGRRFYLRT